MMAPRKFIQSQKASGSKKKRPRIEDDEEETDEEHEEHEEGGGGGGGGGIKGKHKELTEEALNRIANDIVRLALFHEQKKIGISRADINRKIIQEKHQAGARVFSQVLPLAQKIFRKNFGMELFEIRKSGKAGDQDEISTGLEGGKKRGSKKKKEASAAEDEQEEPEEEGEGEGEKKKAKATGNSGVYILRSMLDTNLIQLAMERDPELFLQLDPAERGSGVIVDFELGDDVALMGVLWVILALILINGRQLDDNALRSHLSKLGLSSTSTLPSSSRTGTHFTLDTFLPHLSQHKYIEKVKKDRSAAGGTGLSQPAPANDGEGGDVSLKWEWGPRAEAEIGESALTEFIADLQLRPEEPGEDESRAERAARETKEGKVREKLRRQVTLAASAIGTGLRER